MSTRARLWLPLLAGLLLAACGAVTNPFKGANERGQATFNRPAADGEAARAYLGSLAELQAASPAAQAELMQGAKLAAENAPTTVNRLRYALMLAVPGHAASDPVAARRQLSELLARPELLLPGERALASLMQSDVDARLVLIAENQRTQQDSATRDRDRTAAAAKRLQAEQDESARLRRQLEDVQKKLEAVLQVERSVTGRGNPPNP